MASIDGSHPPSTYRQRFIEGLEDLPPPLTVQDIDFDKVDEELLPHKDALGATLVEALHDSRH